VADGPSSPISSRPSPTWSLLVWLGFVVALSGAAETAHLIAINSPYRLYLAASIALLVFGEGQALWAWRRGSP
jgi:hypothetical protein